MRIALHTGWGLVTLDPFSFAVMPGDDDVVILGNPTVKLQDIDDYDSCGRRAGTCGAHRCRHRGVPAVSPSHRQCRRFLQQQTSLTPEEPDEAVERILVRGPDIDMSLDEELRAGPEALEGAVQALAAAGFRDSYLERLHEVIGRRWNVFRRGLRRGDPPARVEPLHVTLKPGVRPVKARPRVNNPIKTARLASCMPSLASLGLVCLNMQAVWVNAQIATIKGGSTDAAEASRCEFPCDFRVSRSKAVFECFDGISSLAIYVFFFMYAFIFSVS